MPVTLRAACCVTTRCVEAAKPSDDAWEAARAVLRGSVLPVPVDIERQDSLCVCTLPALAPVRAIGLEEAGHPLCVCQAHETLLGGIGGLLVWPRMLVTLSLPITALGSHVSQPCTSIDQ